MQVCVNLNSYFVLFRQRLHVVICLFWFSTLCHLCLSGIISCLWGSSWSCRTTRERAAQRRNGRRWAFSLAHWTNAFILLSGLSNVKIKAIRFKFSCFRGLIATSVSPDILAPFFSFLLDPGLKLKTTHANLKTENVEKKAPSSVYCALCWKYYTMLDLVLGRSDKKNQMLYALPVQEKLWNSCIVFQDREVSLCTFWSCRKLFRND